MKDVKFPNKNNTNQRKWMQYKSMHGVQLVNVNKDVLDVECRITTYMSTLLHVVPMQTSWEVLTPYIGMMDQDFLNTFTKWEMAT